MTTELEDLKKHLKEEIKELEGIIDYAVKYDLKEPQSTMGQLMAYKRVLDYINDNYAKIK